MLDRSYNQDPYILVMLTLDAHSVGSVERIKNRFSKIYPELEKIFLSVIRDSGFPDLKLEKKINFEELYQKRLN